MSYRLIDSNALAIKYPEVNDMPCIYADLDGLDGDHYDMRSPRVLQAENVKLRKLIADMWGYAVNREMELCNACTCAGSDFCDCAACDEYDGACGIAKQRFEELYTDRMCELGVEVRK